MEDAGNWRTHKKLKFYSKFSKARFCAKNKKPGRIWPKFRWRAVTTHVVSDYFFLFFIIVNKLHIRYFINIPIAFLPCVTKKTHLIFALEPVSLRCFFAVLSWNVCKSPCGPCGRLFLHAPKNRRRSHFPNVVLRAPKKDGAQAIFAHKESSRK